MILSDLKGSSCLFFVGNYRDNHVDPNHTLFSLMEKLRVCNIPSTNISLDGLAIEDLNSMISDALCVFPRISMPLSKTVLQKTKGNPFFVMEFMRSLVDSKMLQYSLRERRWVWDEDKIVSEGITDNVLYLLSAKMSVLPESIQTALKIVSCFGIKVHEDIVGYLSATQHSNFRQGLDQAIREGFIDKVGTVFRFVHDRVREAAYSLIHVDDKETFHFNIGMSLYTFTKGKDLGDMIFTIADQINLGLHSLQHAITNSAYIAELNLDAGSKAFDRSDYITAKPYLKVAMSLLPTDHWEQQYDFSLRLYYLTAKAAYSCGDLKEATVTLKKLLSKGRCIDDKLDAQSLLVTILHVSDELEEAYATCKEVLSELGETIPDNFNQKEAERMIVETSKVLGSMSDEDFSNPNEISRKLYYCLKFYSSLSLIAFHSKPEMVPYFTCRMCNLRYVSCYAIFSLNKLHQFKSPH